ncbi:MAG: hypothetical protein JJ949_18065 [Roseicyclus sp.]|nr:hypothetical protein [Roseicyclus sp.]
MKALRAAGARDYSEVHCKHHDGDDIHVYRLVYIEGEGEAVWVEVVA